MCSLDDVESRRLSRIKKVEKIDRAVHVTIRRPLLSTKYHYLISQQDNTFTLRDFIDSTVCTAKDCHLDPRQDNILHVPLTDCQYCYCHPASSPDPNITLTRLSVAMNTMSCLATVANP